MLPSLYVISSFVQLAMSLRPSGARAALTERVSESPKVLQRLVKASQCWLQLEQPPAGLTGLLSRLCSTMSKPMERRSVEWPDDKIAADPDSTDVAYCRYVVVASRIQRSLLSDPVSRQVHEQMNPGKSGFEAIVRQLPFACRQIRARCSS